MSEIKLKPCPFCAGEASYAFDPDGIKDSEGRKWAYQVTCKNCCSNTGLCFSEDMAREAWNRRSKENSTAGEAYRAYLFKKGPLWVGWIIRKNEEPARIYSENAPFTTFRREVEILYLTFGLSYKRTSARIKKRIKAIKIDDKGGTK